MIRQVLVTVAVIAGAVTTAPSNAAGTPCAPAGSRTLAKDSYAAVYGKGAAAYVCVLTSGKTTKLRGASPTADQFALGGKYVGWSSGAAHSIVTVAYVPTGAHSNTYPFDTNDHVDRIVVKSSGAAAWAASPDGDNTYVQGTDRSNHSADTLSDDTKDVKGSSLRSLPGKAITWQYTDGTSDQAELY